MEIKKYSAEKAVGEVQKGEAVALDVRTAEEREAEHIPGSLHIHIDDIEAGEDPDVSKDTKIFTHCEAGGRAERAKEALIARGFTNVHNLGGGLIDWEKAGGPVE